MKTRYKIIVIIVISFSTFWVLTPTIAVHVCAEFDLDWKDTFFCNVNGEMIGSYFVWDPNLSSNPVIQLIDHMTQPKSCTNDKNNESLPSCDDISGFQ